MFLMPYYLLTDPAAAKTLLGYRWRSLPGAFKKASENGYQGAMFPWESAWLDDGEVTPLYCGADIVTGKSSPACSSGPRHRSTSSCTIASCTASRRNETALHGPPGIIRHEFRVKSGGVIRDLFADVGYSGRHE